MITDNLKNANLYAGVSPRVQRAFEYLKGTDLAALPVGRIELDGKNLYVMVQEYTSKTPDQGKWEAHQRYIDLQYIVKGTEKMGYARLNRMQLGAYDPAKDFQAMSGDGDYVTLSDGDFMLVWPEDAHRPGMAAGEPSPVKKVVVKIAVE